MGCGASTQLPPELSSLQPARGQQLRQGPASSHGDGSGTHTPTSSDLHPQVHASPARQQQQQQQHHGGLLGRISGTLLAPFRGGSPARRPAAGSAEGSAGAAAPATAQLGITLRGLRALRARLASELGPSRFAAMSTAAVNAEWVERVTEAPRCRLVELEGVVARRDVRPPSYFISHAWLNRAALLFDHVERFLADASELTAVWLDILSVNQHEDTRAHREDIAAFSDVVRACGAGTIVVMDVANCNPATRGWCIFEWAHTLAAHGPDGLHMALSPADRAAVFSSLDVARASCQFPRDKAMILQEVTRQHGSTEAFNTKLRLQLLLEPLSYSVDLRRLANRAQGSVWDWAPLERWLAGGPRALLLTAGAGEGKSTASALAAGHARLGPQLAAHHFLKYSDQRRLEPVRIIKSLAFQLALRLPAMCSALLQLDAAVVAQLQDEGSAFDMLLAQPLQAHAAAAAAAAPRVRDGATQQQQQQQRQVVILLDALDEADPLEEQMAGGASAPGANDGGITDGPETHDHVGAGGAAATAAAVCPRVCGNRALRLLTGHLARLPPWVRFLITSRPDAAAGQVGPCLERAFAGQGGCQRMGLEQLRPQAAAAGGGGAAGAAAGGGILVYHAVAELCLLPGGSGGADPAAPTAAARPGLADLYRLYRAVFEAAAARYSREQAAATADLLAVLVAGQEPLPYSLLARLGLGEGVVEGLPGWPTLVFADEHHLYMLHKSVADWLCDTATSGPFAVDAARGHWLLARLLAHGRGAAASSPYMQKYLHHHLAAAACGAAAAAGGGGVAGGLDTGSSAAAVADNDLNGSGVTIREHSGTMGELLQSRLGGGGAGTSPLRQPGSPAGGSRATGRALLLPPLPNSPHAPRPDSRAQSVTASAHSRVRLLPPPSGKSFAAAADPSETPRGLLDEVLSDLGLLALLLRNGHGSRVVSALGSMGAHHTALSYDVYRWLRSTLHSTEAVLAALHVAGGAGGGSSAAAVAVAGAAAAGHTEALLQEVLVRTPLACALRRVARSAAAGLCGGAAQWRALAVLPPVAPYTEWDAQVAVFKGDRDMYAVQCVAFSPDARQVVAGNVGAPLFVWDVASGLLLASLEGHTGAVGCAAFSASGRQIASGGADGAARLWDAATGQCVEVLGAHDGSAVTAVAFGPEAACGGGGMVVASGCADGAVRLWWWGEGGAAAACAATLRGHGGPVTRLLVAPAAGAQTLATDGRSDGLQVLSASEDCTIRVWSCDGAGGRAECMATLQGHSQAVTDLWLSPDGCQLTSGGRDATLRTWRRHNAPGPGVWAPADAKPLRLAADAAATATADSRGGSPAAAAAAAATPAPPQAVFWTALSSDGTLAATGGDADETIRVWRTADGACLRELRGQRSPHIRVVWAPAPAGGGGGGGGDLLASSYAGDRTVRLWQWQANAGGGAASSDGRAGEEDRTSGNAAAGGRSPHSPSRSRGSGGTTATSLLGASFGGGACAIQGGLAGGAPTGRRLYAVELSSDGAMLAAASEDGSVALWQAVGVSDGGLDGGAWASAARHLAALPGLAAPARAVAFSADSRHLAGGARDGVRVWSVDAAAAAASLQEAPLEPVACLHDAAAPGAVGVVSVLFGPAAPARQQRLLAAGCSDAAVRLWDVNASSAGGSAAPLATLRATYHAGGTGRGLAFGSGAAAGGGGALLLACAGPDRTVRVWDVGSGQAVASLALDAAAAAAGLPAVWGLAFSPDGTRLAAVSAATLRPAGGRPVPPVSLHVWDMRTWALRRVAPMQQAGCVLSGGCLSPDGRLLVGIDHRAMVVWEVASGRRVGLMHGHDGAVADAAFAAGVAAPAAAGAQPLLASCGRDGTVRLWQPDAEAAGQPWFAL